MVQYVYDPRGSVPAPHIGLSRRPRALDELRVAVLDNTKWNAAKLLHAVTDVLARDTRFAAINHYRKETYTRVASPELLDRIRAENDLAVIAIGD